MRETVELTDLVGDKIAIINYNYDRTVYVNFYNGHMDVISMEFDQGKLVTLIQQLTTALYSMSPTRRYHDDIRSKKENEAGL